MTEADVDNPITVQSIEFLYSLALGVMLGVLYDIFRVVRSFSPKKQIIVAIFDILFWIIALISLLAFVLTVSGGAMRWYVLFGVFGGGFLYMASLSVIMYKTLRTSVLISKKLLGMVTYPLYIALRWCLHTAKKAEKSAEKKRREKKIRKVKRKVVPDGGKKEKEK